LRRARLSLPDSTRMPTALFVIVFNVKRCPVPDTTMMQGPSF
jgi:hypothetical protein